MKTNQLHELESHVESLLQTVERLKSENISLRQKLTHCVRERSQYQQQNKMASTKLNTLIRQLKEET